MSKTGRVRCDQCDVQALIPFDSSDPHKHIIAGWFLIEAGDHDSFDACCAEHAGIVVRKWIESRLDSAAQKNGRTDLELKIVCLGGGGAAPYR